MAEWVSIAISVGTSIVIITGAYWKLQMKLQSFQDTYISREAHEETLRKQEEQNKEAERHFQKIEIALVKIQTHLGIANINHDSETH